MPRMGDPWTAIDPWAAYGRPMCRPCAAHGLRLSMGPIWPSKPARQEFSSSVKVWFSSRPENPTTSKTRLTDGLWKVNIPQTVLALWGSGVFKAGECLPLRVAPHTRKHFDFLSTFQKKCCWRASFAVPQISVSNVSVKLLVFVANFPIVEVVFLVPFMLLMEHFRGF